MTRTSIRPARTLAIAVSAALASGLIHDAIAARPLIERFVGPLPRPAVVDGLPTTVVTNCDDGGAGSLRDAFINAVDGEQIDLTQLDCSTITLTTGALTDSVADLTLIGPGRGQLTIDGSYANRVIMHTGAGDLRVSDLAITRGSYDGKYGGGCVFAAGQASFYDVDVSECNAGSAASTAPVYGGAFYVRGAFFFIEGSITESRVSAPQVNSGGGAIWSGYQLAVAYSTLRDNMVVCDGSHYCRGGAVFGIGHLQIDTSTLFGNSAETGGAVYHRADSTGYGLLLLQESTLSGNRASGAAGGAFGTNDALILDSTIAFNQGYFPFGAGVYLLTDHPATMYGTIIARNTSEDGLSEADFAASAGLVVNGSNNLVMSSTIALPADTILADPLLGPLQNNGGFAGTYTHALGFDSPALDHGIDRAQLGEFVYDQRGRGFARTIGAATDIGAFEQGASDVIFADGFDHEN